MGTSLGEVTLPQQVQVSAFSVRQESALGLTSFFSITRGAATHGVVLSVTFLVIHPVDPISLQAKRQRNDPLWFLVWWLPTIEAIPRDKFFVRLQAQIPTESVTRMYLFRRRKALELIGAKTLSYFSVTKFSLVEVHIRKPRFLGEPNSVSLSKHLSSNTTTGRCVPTPKVVPQGQSVPPTRASAVVALALLTVRINLVSDSKPPHYRTQQAIHLSRHTPCIRSLTANVHRRASL